MSNALFASGAIAPGAAMPAPRFKITAEAAALFFHTDNASLIAHSAAPTGFSQLRPCSACDRMNLTTIMSWQRAVHRPPFDRGERCAVLGRDGAAELRRSRLSFAFVIRAHPSPGVDFEEFAQHSKSEHGKASTLLQLQPFSTNESAVDWLYPGEHRVWLCGRNTAPRRGKTRGIMNACWSSLIRRTGIHLSPRISRRLFSEPIYAAKQIAGVLCDSVVDFGWHYDAPNPAEWQRSGASGDWWWHLIRPLPQQPSQEQRRRVVEMARARQCVSVANSCFNQEQIIVHGASASILQRKLLRLLNRSMDVTEAFRELRPWYRNTVVKVPVHPTAASYLPLAVSAQIVSLRSEPLGRWRWRNEPFMKQPIFVATPQPPLALFTSFVENLGELFVRSIPYVFELTQTDEGTRHMHRILPAMLPEHFWPLLDAFSSHGVEPMSLFPNETRHEQLSLVHARADRLSFEAYRRRSIKLFESRQPERCYERAIVCDMLSDTGQLQQPWFRRLQGVLRPWSAMQAILRHHGVNDPDANTHRMRACSSPRNFQLQESCPLRVSFVLRANRRLLLNAHALMRQCNSWTPAQQPSLRVLCDTIRFSQRPVQFPISDIDVLITPHGADVVNALKMHSGASLVEVMPVLLPGSSACAGITAGCSDTLTDLQNMIRAEPKIRHYRLFTDRPQHARVSGGHAYDANLVLPWDALRSVLDDVVSNSRNSTGGAK